MNVKLKKYNVLEPSVLIKEQIYIDTSQPIREIKGVPPLKFKTVDEEVIDWYIKGAEGGVGRIGLNYLKQTERTMPDGTYGKRVYQTPSWITARTGTFNSGQATTIGFNFHKSGNSNIVPANVGKIYIAEGNSDPVTEGVELSIFQGGISAKGDAEGVYWDLRYGDDGSGNDVIYSTDDSNYIAIRCGTAIYRLKPNTDYSFARVGGDNDVEIQYITGKDSAELDISWSLVSNLNSIPGNKSPVKNTEQWTTVSGYNLFFMNTTNWYQYLDSRPATYEYCAYYADLKAGHYKVVAECFGEASDWGVSHIYNDQTPYMALISEDNTQIITKRSIFQGTGKWHHEEYDFTINSDTKVGLYFKAINKPDKHNFVRFGIFDYNVEAEPFETDYSGTTITGVTCWQPYQIKLPVVIMTPDGSRAKQVIFDLGVDMLGANDVISYSSTNILLPTFIGENIITVETPIQPSEMYIKYRRL